MPEAPGKQGMGVGLEQIDPSSLQGEHGPAPCLDSTLWASRTIVLTAPTQGGNKFRWGQSITDSGQNPVDLFNMFVFFVSGLI